MAITFEMRGRDGPAGLGPASQALLDRARAFRSARRHSLLVRALRIATRLDPLSYGVDGMRAALIGQAHFGAPKDLEVLAVVGTILLCVGAWRFSKIEI